VDVNIQTGHYDIALQATVFGGHDQIVRRLLKERADVNSQTIYFGSTLQTTAIGVYNHNDY
jgi:hypothetical protein